MNQTKPTANHWDQPTLFPLADYNKSDNPEERFIAFHLANPHVLLALHQMARGMKAQGFKTGAIKLLLERLRWLWAMQTKGEAYKINNNYAPFYARVLMEYDPILADFFKVRQQSSQFQVNLRRLNLYPQGGDPAPSI